jgi:2,3-dihydro-2,3-dihydroxybenzoate dehydrogenase
MTTFQLEPGWALVTGGGSGIGLAVVQGLLQNDVRVVAWDNDASALGRLSRVLGPRVTLDRVDVSDAGAVDEAFWRAERALGTPGSLVNCAGVLCAGSLIADDFDPQSLRRAFAVHVGGVLNVTRRVCRAMMPERRGAIVTVSSNACDTPRIGMGAYAASKAASTQLTRCFGLELARHGIRCNVVSPGSTHTPMLAELLADRDPGTNIEGAPEDFRLGIPLGRIAEPADIAQAVLFLLSRSAQHVTLHDLRVDGGATL